MMLTALTRLALRQRVLSLVAMSALVIGGIFAWRSMPIDAFPDMAAPQVDIIMKVPGMTPKEVETRVVIPIEQSLLGIANKKIVRSISKYGLADITVDFDGGTDVYWARQQVNEALQSVSGELPPTAHGGLAPITTPLSDLYMFTVEGDGYSIAQRRSTLEWVIRPILRTVPGVSDVNMLGGVVRAFVVEPDLAKLSAWGLSLSQLHAALMTNNSNDGAGRLDDGEEARIVRVEGAFTDTSDIRNTVIATVRGTPVRVGDVARVIVSRTARYGIVTANGKGPAVEGIVEGLPGANSEQVIRGVKARLAELAPHLPPGMKIHMFYSRTDLINRAVGTVTEALLEAVALVILMLLVFLGNWRAAMVVAITLPLSALATFVLMRWAGMSANLMSLGGLAIALGMLVDAAVVVVENLVSHMSHDPEHRSDPNPGSDISDRLSRVLRGVSEVSTPVLAGVLIIVIVFLPLLSLQGLSGKLFRPVAITIVFALASSLLIALTFVPVMASLMLKSVGHNDPWLVRKLSAGYRHVLDWAFAHSRTIIMLALVSLIGAAFAYTRVGKTFMPILDEGNVIVQLETLPSINLNTTAALDMQVEKALLKDVPEIKDIYARSGSDQLGLDPMGLNSTDTFLVFKPRKEWHRSKQQVLAAMRNVLNRFPGLAYSFTQPIQMRIADMLTGSRGDLVVKIFGPNLQQLSTLSQEIANVLKSVRGAEEVIAPRPEGVEYLTVKVNRLAAGRAGFDIQTLEQDLRAMVQGEQVGIVLEGVRRIPLVLRGEADVRQNPQTFSHMMIVGPHGTTWPLSQLAEVLPTEGPAKIAHEDGSRFAQVQANVSGRALVSFVDAAKRAVAEKVKLPEGVHLQWAGQFQNQQHTAARLGKVVPIALVLIFVLLMTTFGSIRQAVLVFVNIPFALVGGILALWISDQYLSVPASVGFIALLGIAVLNGLVLVSHFNELLQRGLTLQQAARDGAMRRMRPVMMTATITALGLIPLLLATGPGSEIQKPLAIVVVGGLVTSTILTLVLLPLLFARFGVPPAARKLEANKMENV